MSNDPIPTEQQMDALRELIRCGAPLTDEQRKHLAPVAARPIGSRALRMLDEHLAQLAA